MRSNLLEAFMGGVVLIIAAIFLGIVYTTSDAPSTDGYILNAAFSRADGLTVGGDVKLSGVRVGTISSIHVDPQSYQAIVTFRIKAGLTVPEDSSAEITSEGLLGGKYIAIVPGGSNSFLQDGEDFEHTESSLSLEGLITKFLTSGAASTPAAAAPAQSTPAPQTRFAGTP